MVNPVQSSNNQNLTDQNDPASAVPASQYAIAPLRNLDGSGYLRGKWAVVRVRHRHPGVLRHLDLRL